MKIAFGVRDNIVGRYFVESLMFLDPRLILVEKDKTKKKFIFKKIKQMGLCNVIYAGYKNWLFKRKASKCWGKLSPFYHVVKTLNSEEVVRGIEDLRIDLLVVFGTSILKAKIIEAPKIGIINLHTGILPEYRGCKSEFWALYNNEPEMIGSTVHWIDEGIDTGDIIAIRKIRVPQRMVDAGDVDEIKIWNIESGLGLVASVVLTNFKETRIKQVGGNYYSTPTIKEWRKLKEKR